MTFCHADNEASTMLFQRFFSVDSPKAVKAQKYGWLNAINYMAPHRLAGVGNLCPHASKGCIALCLGEHSGNAALYPAVLKSRIAKAQLLMRDRQAFLKEITAGIRRARAKAKRQKLRLCVRLNGATDIAWERLAPAIFADNADLQFVDYTKSFKRALEHAAGQFPANYHLTFSRSETNEDDCRQVLAAGGNVAVVFAGEFPEHYLGHRVINGDAHDLRHLDGRGVVVALSPKGRKAKADKSGFVVRS
jgi:hypothetical protein